MKRSEIFKRLSCYGTPSRRDGAGDGPEYSLSALGYSSPSKNMLKVFEALEQVRKARGRIGEFNTLPDKEPRFFRFVLYVHLVVIY